jgi:hypothetical protein
MLPFPSCQPPSAALVKGVVKVRIAELHRNNKP